MCEQPRDWDASWRRMQQEGGVDRSSLGRPEEATPSPNPADSSEVFILAPPSQPPEDFSGEGSLLAAFASEKGLLRAMGVLVIVFCFMVGVGLTGGITDGTDRFANPEPMMATERVTSDSI